MNIVIFGSRGLYPDAGTIFEFVRQLENYDTEGDIRIITGMAIGVDTAALRFAELHDYGIIKMPADWDKYGKKAGVLRNQEMVEIADAALCFWDGKSPGTKDMIKRVLKKDIPFIMVKQ